MFSLKGGWNGLGPEFCQKIKIVNKVDIYKTDIE